MIRLVCNHLLAWTMCLALLVSPSVGQTLDEVLSANESAVGLVHRIDMTVDSYRLSFNGKRFDPPMLRSTWRWCKDGERQRHRSFSYDEQGKKSQFRDLLENGREWRVLRNWNPDDPPQLHPREQEGVYASMEPKGPNMMFSVEALFAMMRITLESTDPRRTLREFVAAAQSASLVGTERMGERETLRILVTDPACSTRQLYPDCTVAVYVDRSANYMIRRIERSWSVEVPGNSDVSRTTYVAEVKRFEDYGGGVYLPAEVETRMLAPAFMEGPTVEDRMVARNVIVNAPLPGDALDFRHPDNAVVREIVPGGGKRIWLWGDDDQPKKEIKELADLGPHRTTGSRGLPSRRVPFFLVLGTTLLLGAVIFVIVRRKRK